MTKPTIPEYKDRFHVYHETNPIWGSLHIVLEDQNVADHFVKSCIEKAKGDGDVEGASLARVLLQMSVTQRRKLAHMLWAD